MTKIKVVLCPIGFLKDKQQYHTNMLEVYKKNVLFHYIDTDDENVLHSHIEFIKLAIQNMDLLLVEVKNETPIELLRHVGIDIVAISDLKDPENGRLDYIMNNQRIFKFKDMCVKYNIPLFEREENISFDTAMYNLNMLVKKVYIGEERYVLSGYENSGIVYESQMVCYRMVMEKIESLEKGEGDLPDDTRDVLLSTLKREAIILSKLQNSALDSIGKQLDQYRLLMKNTKLYLIDEDEYKYMNECVNKIEQIKGLV